MKSGDVEGIKTSTPLLGSYKILSDFLFSIVLNYSTARLKSLAERLKGKTFLYYFNI